MLKIIHFSPDICSSIFLNAHWSQNYSLKTVDTNHIIVPCVCTIHVYITVPCLILNKFPLLCSLLVLHLMDQMARLQHQLGQGV